MPLAVRCRAAVCLLGRFPALAGADLDVGEREAVLLSGPNGAGKTTLLRLLAGLVRLHSGSAEVLDTDLAVDRRSHRRMVSLVGHDTSCYDDLSTRENLRFATRAAGRTGGEADAALERVGITDVADVAHARLSAGQRRRLSLAIGLARDPRLLLLDEPHAGLDSDGRALVDEVVRAASREGRAVVIASHEVERARPLVNREVRVVGGRAFDAPAVDERAAEPEATARSRSPS